MPTQTKSHSDQERGNKRRVLIGNSDDLVKRQPRALDKRSILYLAMKSSETCQHCGVRQGIELSCISSDRQSGRVRPQLLSQLLRVWVIGHPASIAVLGTASVQPPWGVNQILDRTLGIARH